MAKATKKNDAANTAVKERTPLTNRIDAVILFDCKMGNPNQEPEAGGRAREVFDRGVVSSGSQKRKIRDFWDLTCGDKPGCDVYYKRRAILNLKNREAFKKGLGIEDADKKDGPQLRAEIKEAAAEMGIADPGEAVGNILTSKYIDNRVFGVTATTAKTANLSCSQITGPVEITDAVSVDPVYQQAMTITRCSVNKESDAEKKDTEMATRYIVPYALYKSEMYINAYQAMDTGMDEEDLQLLLKAIENMFEFSRSASNGTMTMRKIVLFRHESPLGNAHSHQLIDRVKIERKPGIEEAEKYSDYDISVDLEGLPEGVTCEVRSW